MGEENPLATDQTEGSSSANQASDEGVPEGEILWDQLIDVAAADRAVARRVLRHEGDGPSASRPQRYLCDDGAVYSVKFRENQHGDGRGIFAEQVVSLGGRLLGAPVAQVDLVHVSEDLVAQLSLPFNPQAGPHHGSQWAHGYSDRQHIAYVDENREAFGALHVLYTWMLCNGDHQFIYRNAAPHEVLSVDHSAFFPGGPDWTGASVAGVGPLVEDPILAPLSLGPEHRAAALAKLAGVRPTDIARIVATPSDEWGVPVEDRVTLARYLYTRQNEATALFAP